MYTSNTDKKKSFFGNPENYIFFQGIASEADDVYNFSEQEREQALQELSDELSVEMKMNELKEAQSLESMMRDYHPLID